MEFISEALVIGVGNADRRDDAAGLAVAQAITAQGLAHLRVLESDGDAEALMEAWQDAGVVGVIDAVCAGGAPGSVYRFDASAHPLPATFVRHSTHLLSVGEAIELARALGRLPARLLVYGIEGACFETGVGLSPAVEAAAKRLARSVPRELREVACAVCGPGNADA